MGYTIYVIPQAWQEMKTLPGNMRQRIKLTVDGLAIQPRPQRSKELRVAGHGIALCRLRIERWRLIYAIDEQTHIIQVLAIRKRPPYNYDDLDELLQQIQ